MNDPDTDLLGRLQAIESFLISPVNRFGIIGDMLGSVVRPGAYAHIGLNPSFSLTARIDEVKEIQLSNEGNQHKLLLFHGHEEDANDILHALNIGGNEIIEIRISGED